ncbi:ImmA/IrrE family metallo-endopeptidase [Methylocapsa aurea]|uniref:ImmA/IrrE family metallo-endopeptidase n=1 Tax=Methylocapsa aurea TaxID=663610 RepID=UPI003D18A1A0
MKTRLSQSLKGFFVGGAPLTRPDYRKAKSAALELLAQNAILRPPVNPMKLARGMGLEVVFVEFDREDQNISGFYDAEDNTIFVNGDESPLRQTFTVAHELGHKILHEEWAKSGDYRILMRNQSEESANDPKEKEANSFAANLLVPRFMLDEFWPQLGEKELSRLFAVSVPVIKIRLSFEYGV